MKKKRQAEILDIIRNNCVENQEMMQKLLLERGYEVTQATVSRDINELNLEKGVSSSGVSCYMQASQMNNSRFESIFQQAVVSIDRAMNIVCLKCHAGLANAACATFDLMNLSFIVGTIAGDDTVFILVKTEDEAENLVEQLRRMI